jgi:hypothetical protein
MNSRPRKSTIAALAAASLFAFPAGATSAVDDSQNAATSDYEHGPLPPSGLAKDYSKNSATGDFAPAKPGSAQVLTVADNGGFDWGDATIGAVVTLALAIVALGATKVARRRRIASPAT